MLGHGCFGNVHTARWRGGSVACKMMHRSRLNEHDIAVALRSAQLQLSLPSHPNIVRLHGLAWSCENACVINVMELCAGGTLAAALETSAIDPTGKQALGWRSHKLSIAAGLAQGLAFMHEQSPPIIHRDIKPENILLTDDRRSAKIADLGLCRELASDVNGPLSAQVGTPAFSAPEALYSTGCVLEPREKTGRPKREPYDQRADLWSFGCVLICMDGNRKYPYSDQQASEDTNNFINELVKGRFRPAVRAASPFFSLVHDCCRDVVLRPTATQLAARLLEDEMIELCEAEQRKVENKI